jgi:hypothetical protein
MMGPTSLHNSRSISMTAPQKHSALSQAYFNNKTFGNFNNETYLRLFAEEV